MTLVARTKTQVWGSTNAWSLAPQAGWGEPRECAVEVEIDGDDSSGYHLIMSPVGFFTADSWHETLDDALDAAVESLGIPRDAWTAKQPREQA